MCKILAITDMSNVNFNRSFVAHTMHQVCKKGDKDGFGYAALGKNHCLGGERTVEPYKFKPLPQNIDKLVTRDLPVVRKTWDRFGIIPTKPKSYIGHGRLSTNTVNVENTHPFVGDKVALIHNGVVSDETDFVKQQLTTNNDSEILLRYWEMGGMKEVEDNVSGYYAMAVLDKSTGYLHIIRDDRAMLYMAWCRTINSYVIATTIDIIVGLAKKMKWKVENPEEVLPNIHIVFDGNKIISHTKIEPIGMMNSNLRYQASRALGHGEAEDWDNASYREWNPKTGYVDRRTEYVETNPETETTPSYKESSNEITTDIGSDDSPDESEYADEDEVKDLVDEMSCDTFMRIRGRYNA